MNDIVEQRLQNTIVDLEADLAQHQRQLDETQGAISDIQEAIAELKRLMSDRGSVERRSLVTAASRPTAYGDSPTSPKESTPTAKGSLEGLNRRQLVRRMVPEFHGKTFTASDVREMFLEQYLEVEPPNFRQALNNLLQKMAEGGDAIEKAGRKGTGRRDPWLYREKENQEESLSLGP